VYVCLPGQNNEQMVEGMDQSQEGQTIPQSRSVYLGLLQQVEYQQVDILP